MGWLPSSKKEKFKGFWHKLIKRFQNKIGFDKDEKYKYVSDDLYKNGVFDDNDNRIVNDVARKIWYYAKRHWWRI